MAADFVCIAGLDDTWTGNLQVDGVNLDVTGLTVTFVAKPVDGLHTITKSGFITDAATGAFAIVFDEADTANPGRYLCSFRVSDGGSPSYDQAIPSDSFLTMLIAEDRAT